MDQAHITTNNLNFYYVNFHVLKNINLTFPKNKITSLLGPSGSGKSTLLRCFNRIYELTPKCHATGEVEIEQQNILDKSLDTNWLRRYVGMVFQKPTPFPMSIRKNISFALKMNTNLTKKEIDHRIESSLKSAALWDEVYDKLDKAGSHLSGGQQQRLCIARTMSVHPKILLLDEPTSALDPISTKKIEQVITSLKNKLTIVWVTHNLEQAHRISDKTILMSSGEVIESGDTNQIFNHPTNSITKQYLNSL